MVKKIVSSLNSINPFSKNIILYASLISFGLCISGVGVILYNIMADFTKNSLYKLGSSLIYYSITFFAQLILASLVIDFFNNIIKNHED